MPRTPSRGTISTSVNTTFPMVEARGESLIDGGSMSDEEGILRWILRGIHQLCVSQIIKKGFTLCVSRGIPASSADDRIF